MSRLDDYIESVVSQMELEGAQRAEMEKELRAPLERIVKTGLAKGLTRDQAEYHTLLAAKWSAFLYKYFGIAPKNVWASFEYVSAFLYGAIILLIAVPTIIAFHKTDVGSILYFFFILIVPLMLLFNQGYKRVEIRNGLYVHTLGKKARQVPFDTIRRIRFPRLTLVRTRIVIETADKPVVLERRFNGFPGAAAALIAFASDKMDRKVERHLTKIKSRIWIPYESSRMRLILTLFWTIIAAGFLIFIGPLWEGFGFGLALVIVLIAATITIYLQGRTHVDTVKRGLCMLLCLIVLVAFALFVCAILGASAYARWFSACVFAMIIGAVVVLWWRWSRVVLVGLLAVGAFLVFSSRFIFPALYVKEPTPLVLEAISPFQILGSEGPIVWMSACEDESGESYFQTLETANLNGETHWIKLEKPGYWELTDPTPFQQPCVLRKIPHYPEAIREVHIYDQEISTATKVVTLPPGNDAAWLHFSLFSIWSPDAKYLITITKTYEREILNVDNGSVTRIGKRFYPFEWIDGKTLLARFDPRLKLGEADDSTSAGSSNSIELWKFDMEKGTRELFVRRELTEREECQTTLPGLKYAVIYHYEIPPPAGVAHEQPPDSCSLMHIQTGETLSIPIPSGFPFLFSSGWNKEKEILAYVAAPENQDEGPRIVVVDVHSRSIKTRIFPPNKRIENVRLSPDGKKILFNRMLKDDRHLPWFQRLDLWDIEKDEIIPIRSFSVINILLALDEYPLWSPDSTWFAYPFSRISMKGFCGTIEVLKFP
jgi:hypothetical protein